MVGGFFGVWGYLKLSSQRHSNALVWGLIFKLKYPKQLPYIPARKGRWSVPLSVQANTMAQAATQEMYMHIYMCVCAYPFGAEI